ncbi:MAG: glycosyltransferase family 2 protein [Bryobacterales bacterium]|jgi:hypothetical protein|nr:glycosyltransferase family 2 protein [Bryobacterales bacterium]
MNQPEQAPIVSVVVPLYNKAPYVHRSLDSIRRQSIANIEVIIVNDGSTDDSVSVAQSLIADDRRFRIVSQANGGPGTARNRGASEAVAPWIAFLDADDEWDEQYLELSLAFAARFPQEPVVVCSGHWLNGKDKSTERLWRGRGLDDGLVMLNADTDPQYLAHLIAFLWPCSLIIQAEAVRRWSGFYENRCVYGEDSYLFVKLVLRESVALQMRPLAVYHTEASGLANNLRRRTPVEPMLTDPEPLRAVCPPHLQPLLASFLAVRAFRRTVVLAYWGDWRAARALRARFRTPGDWRLPHFWRALLAANPLGAVAGFLLRQLLRKG